MSVTAERLAKVYIRIRDKRAELKREFESQDEALEEQMNAIEAELLTICDSTGATSLRTSAGTVIKGVRTRYWTGDWSAMHKFIKEHDAPYLLERRIAQGEMATWLKENPDALPPGLNADSKHTITVRRSKS